MSIKSFVSNNNSNNSKKPKLYRAKQTPRIISEQDMKWNLTTTDGTYLGAVSWDAIQAVRDGKIDEYTPKPFEKSIIEKYMTTPQFELATGKKVSYGAFKAIQNYDLDNYKPVSDEESDVLSEFRKAPLFLLETGEYSRYGQGNIDLFDRPEYQNEDGTISILGSISFNDGGKEILIPTIIKDENGKAKKLTDKEAIDHYRQTGEYLGKFDTADAANNYAQKLSLDLRNIYANEKISYDALGYLQNFKADEYISNYATESEKATIGKYMRYRRFTVKDINGKEIGEIPYSGYIALMTGDTNYQSSDPNEMEVLKKYFSQPIFPLEITTDDGEVINFGNVNAEWVKFLSEGGITQQMLDDMQESDGKTEIEKTLKNYANYIDSLDDPEDVWDYLSTVPYAFEKIGAGFVDAVFDVSDIAAGVVTKAGAVVTWGSWEDKLNDLSDHYFSAETYGDKWSESVDSRYRVPDWAKEYLGPAAINFGSMLPSVIAEVYTAGASPALDMQLANTTGQSATKTALTKFANGLVKPKASDVALFSTASSSSLKEKYKETGDLWGSINYGVLNGLGEVFTEKLLNGYGGTNIGADDALINIGNTKLFKKLGTTKVGQALNNKYVNKIGDTLLEGVEEVMMTAADPIFQKITTNPDLDLGKELFNAPYAESFLQGVMLSAFSNATFKTISGVANYVPTKSKIDNIRTLNGFAEDLNAKLPESEQFSLLKKTASTNAINKRATELQRVDSILALNNLSEAINSIQKSEADKFEPLKLDSTEKEIAERRELIDGYGDMYSALVVNEIIANNPEIAEALGVKADTVSVGDVYRNTETGSNITVVSQDDTQTIFEVNNGKTIERKVVSNEKIGTLVTNPMYEKISSGSSVDNSGVSVGDVYTDNRSGKTATVVSRDGANTVLAIQNGSETTQRTISNESFGRMVANGQIERSNASTPTTVTENAPATTENVSGTKNIRLTRVGNNYEVYGDVALALAEQLGMETTRKVVNGVETDVLEIDANFAVEWANAMADDGYTIAFSDRADISPQNESVTDETETTDETTPTEEENVTESEIDVVTNAIEDTLTPEAKNDLVNGEVKENYVRIAKSLIDVYGVKGTITEDFGFFFTDNGKMVDEAIGNALGETTTEVKSNAEETHDNTTETHDNTTETKVSGQDIKIGDTFYFPDQKRTYKVTEKSEKSTTFDVTNEDGSTITKKMSNNLVEKHFTDDKRVDKSSEPKVLKNEQESDTIDSTKESKPVESEDNGNESVRESVLHEDGGRRGSESTKKQAERLSSFERENQGRDATEREQFAKELIERGQVEEVTYDEDTFMLVKPEAYNDDMKSMVEAAEADGDELGFFVGVGKTTYTDENGVEVTDYFDGVVVSQGKIFVQYDGVVPPQKLRKHEHVHDKWDTPEVQKAKDTILGSLTDEDKQNIFSQNRYSHYMEAYKNEDAVLQEFVCDVMAGMNEHIVENIDAVTDYWNGNETVDTYKVAEYSESIDAGGEDTAKSKHKYTTKDLQKISSKNKQRYSLSSMGATFFGDESISSEEFEKMLEDGSYKKHKGYIDYVKDCVKVYKQSRGIKDMLPGSEVKKIEQQIEGIMRVAIAAKKAGYDIFDDGETRTKKDSKKRLLFSSLEPNSDYVTSSDVSTICDKAKNFTEIHDAIIKLEEERGVPDDQRFFKNIDNYFILHKLLADKGLTIPCDECYVQSMRKNLTPMADAFRQLVQEENPNNKDNEQLYHKDGKDKGNIKKNNAEIRNKVRELCSSPDCPIKLEDLTVQMLTTADGLATLRCQAPLLYETFNSFYGQSKPKMPREATPFRPGELIAMFTNSKGQIKNGLVNKIRATGGFRLQSYSDFQIKNFVDVLQTIFEASMVGLNGHAYTKVPAFLEATEGTNLKRNISIFMYEDGGDWKLDKKNSFPMELEDIYALVATDESGNTSIIAVSQNESMSAWIMANDNVGYGIPFHKSGTRMEVVRGRIVKTPDGREILGYANQKDHTKQQTEVWKTTVGDNKENTKVKKPIDIYKFWDFKNKDNLSKKELIEKNLKRYIDECNKNNYRPKFREYLMDNESVLNETLKYAKELGFVSQDATIDDISFKYDEYTIPYGYYKFLGDFGMFNAEGKASPIEVLSLENYDFDKAVDFFKDSSKLRINELLQQFENGEVRDRYRKMVENGEMTAEQLEDVLKEKRNQIANEVVGAKYSFADKKENGELNGHEQNDNSEKLGWIKNSSESLGPSRVDNVGQTQSKKSDTPHTRKVHRSGVSAETLTSSGLTTEQAALREQNITDGVRSEFYTKAKINGEEQAEHFNTENSAYYPDAAFERDEISVKNGVASFTEKRFNDLIEEYSVPDGGKLSGDYAKGYVAYISPSDFLSLTAVNEDRIVQDTKKYGGLDVETLQNNDVRQGPYLEIDFEDGVVVEHNGRHRMVMLRNAGIEKVAIVVRSLDVEKNKYKTQKMTNVAVAGQEFHKIGTAPGKVTLDEIIPLSPNYRNEVREKFVDNDADVKYSFANNSDYLETQKKIESIAQGITHDELIELAKKNTQEFVDKVKENKSLQKRLSNAKRQMLANPKPMVNVAIAGKVTKDILKEMDSTLKAKDLQEDVISIYTEYAQAVKKSGGVKSKVQEANDNMVRRFTTLAVDIADNAEVFVESEMYGLIKSYVKETRIKVPDEAKNEADYAEFRKSHMGTFNLTNDGLDIDMAYQELCEMFPGMFDAEIANPTDQLYAIADTLENLKPYAYNPYSGQMQDAIDHIVYRFVSEADGMTAMPKTKAQKMAERAKVDKDLALDKERENFARKLDREKAKSEKNIQALQKKINDAKYVRYWEKRLSKEEKQEAVQKVRDNQKKAVLKSKIRNIVADMKKHLDKTEKNGGYPKELVRVAAEVCSAIDFQTGRTNKDGTPTKASLRLAELRNQYDALKDSPNYDFQTEHSEEISERIRVLNQSVENKRVVDLTLDELTKLKDILSEIHHSLSIASKQIGIAEARTNMEIHNAIVDGLERIDKGVTDSANSLVTTWRMAVEKGESLIINPNRIFEMVANYDKNSEFWKLYEGILQGERNRKKFTMDANMPFDELTSGGANELAYYDFRTKNYKTGIKYVDGTEVEIPKSIICELVMLWERNDGKKHLASGGMKIPDMKRFNKGETKDAMTSGKLTRAITQADITRLRGMLDSYDKAWINRAYHLFNKVGKDAINEVSMQLVGREIAKAKNYIRAYVDSDFVRQDINLKSENITLEGHGSLKETDPNAQNPVVLRGLQENVYDHIDFVSKYHGLAIPIRNFNKVYKLSDVGIDGHRSIKSMLDKKFGSAIRDDVIVRSINELQNPRRGELSIFNKVRGNWLDATFFGNVPSMLKQTTSYWTASSILDESSLVKGLPKYIAHKKQTRAEIAKYSGTLYQRSQGLSTTELGDRANRKRLAGASSKTAKAINKIAPWLRNIPEGLRPSNWLQSMDCATSAALWEACKVQVSKTMNASEDGYMKAVADLYERVIEETQSNYDILHRPEVLKSTNEITKTVTMFQNDNLQQTGILKASYGNLKAKYKTYKSDKSEANKQALKDASKRMNKAIRARVYSCMWMAAVKVLGDMLLRRFKPYIDDEEKEITARSVLEQMKLSMCEDMLGVLAPIVGELYSSGSDTFTEGWDFMNVPAFDTIEEFIKATSKIWDAATNDEDGDFWKTVAGNLRGISNMTGVPVKNIYDMFKSIKSYVGDIKVGEFAHDIEDYTSGNERFYNYGDLASYIATGDKEKEEKFLEYYGDGYKKGNLTKEMKPVFVQMYVDDPEKAKALQKKLVLEYDYTDQDFVDWMFAEYLKNVVPDVEFPDGSMSDPEYAAEIKDAIPERIWKSEYAYKAVRSVYKDSYKNEPEDDTKALRKALKDSTGVSEKVLSQWEQEANEEIEKQKQELDKEKEKYR